MREVFFDLLHIAFWIVTQVAEKSLLELGENRLRKSTAVPVDGVT